MNTHPFPFTLWLPETRTEEWRTANNRWCGLHFAPTFFGEEWFGKGRGENYSYTFTDYRENWRWGRGWMMRGLTEYDCSPRTSNNLERLTARLLDVVLNP